MDAPAPPTTWIDAAEGADECIDALAALAESNGRDGRQQRLGRHHQLGREYDAADEFADEDDSASGGNLDYRPDRPRAASSSSVLRARVRFHVALLRHLATWENAHPRAVLDGAARSITRRAGAGACAGAAAGGERASRASHVSRVVVSGERDRAAGGYRPAGDGGHVVQQEANVTEVAVLATEMLYDPRVVGSAPTAAARDVSPPPPRAPPAAHGSWEWPETRGRGGGGRGGVQGNSAATSVHLVTLNALDMLPEPSEAAPSRDALRARGKRGGAGHNGSGGDGGEFAPRPFTVSLAPDVDRRGAPPADPHNLSAPQHGTGGNGVGAPSTRVRPHERTRGGGVSRATRGARPANAWGWGGSCEPKPRDERKDESSPPPEPRTRRGERDHRTAGIGIDANHFSAFEREVATLQQRVDSVQDARADHTGPAFDAGDADADRASGGTSEMDRALEEMECRLGVWIENPALRAVPEPASTTVGAVASARTRRAGADAPAAAASSSSRNYSIRPPSQTSAGHIERRTAERRAGETCRVPGEISEIDAELFKMEQRLRETYMP